MYQLSYIFQAYRICFLRSHTIAMGIYIFRFVISQSLLILLLTLQLPLLTKAQEKPFFIFTEDDGLANNDVFDITQDRRGYLWVATKDGLSKYNGEKFRNFRIPQGLPSNLVRAVAHDGEDHIFAGCFLGGLAVIQNNVVLKTFHVSGILNDTYRKLYYSVKHQILFIGTDYGIFGLKDSTLFNLAKPNLLDSRSSILAITEFDGIIYFTVQSPNDGGGLYKIEVNDSEPKESVISNIIGGSSAYGCTVMDNSIFANLGSRIYKFFPKTGKNIEFARAENQFIPWSICPLGPHKLGLGGWAESMYMPGIHIVDLLTCELSLGPYNLRSPSINNLIYDPETKVNWVCSDIGLYCLYDSPFEVYNNIDKVRIKDFEILDDIIYVLTDDHLWQINDGKWKLLYDRKQLDGIISRMQNSYISKQGNTKYSKYQLNKLLNKGKPLELLNFNFDLKENYLLTSKGTVSFLDLKTYLPITSGKFIKDEKGRFLWIVPRQPIRYFQSAKDSIDNLPIESSNINPVKNILKVLRKGDIIYCASTLNGLYTVKGRDIFCLNSINSKLDNSITDIDIDNNGDVWCTSSSGNLFHLGFDGKPMVIQTFNESNSKISGDNYKWLKFNKQYLYVGSNKGLNKIPLSQLGGARIDTLLFYNKFNGYEYFSANSPVSDNHGNIYVTTPERIIKILNGKDNLPELKIIIQNIWVDDHHVTYKQLTEKSLSHITRDITITFAVTKLPNSKNVEYHYKLNNNWWENGNSIVLQSLKPGKYRIEFEAVNKETSLRVRDLLIFQIDAPFWLSWWFILLSSLLISLLLYWILDMRFRKKKKEANEKSMLTLEIAELHIQSLQSQMNPHFIFNSLNSIQSYILSNNMEDAATYLGTLGSIIRMNLENVSEEYISLPEEIRFLEKYVQIEKMRFKERLHFKIFNTVFNSDKTFLPPMLIQPLIENSIKHGIRLSRKDGEIKLEFSMTEDLLNVTVIDNGIGMSQSVANSNISHKSMGINLITKRLILLNEKYKTTRFQIHISDLIDSGNQAGTKVSITIPQITPNVLPLKVSLS